MKPRGFTLIEILVVIGIIGVLATVATVGLFAARTGARDKVRVATINGIGRLLTNAACIAPSGGDGDYDLKTVADEYVAAHPEVAGRFGNVPRDPKTGTDAVSGYRYYYEAGRCAAYANLEAKHEVTLTGVTGPSPAAGYGYFAAPADGPNGSPFYYQFVR